MILTLKLSKIFQVSWCKSCECGIPKYSYLGDVRIIKSGILVFGEFNNFNSVILLEG